MQLSTSSGLPVFCKIAKGKEQFFFSGQRFLTISGQHFQKMSCNVPFYPPAPKITAQVPAVDSVASSPPPTRFQYCFGVFLFDLKHITTYNNNIYNHVETVILFILPSYGEIRARLAAIGNSFEKLSILEEKVICYTSTQMSLLS